MDGWVEFGLAMACFLASHVVPVRLKAPLVGLLGRRGYLIGYSLLSLVLLFGATILALTGPWIVDFLYDARYTLAGGILVAIACIQLLQVIPISYDYSALAAGDSRAFFIMQSTRAAIYAVFVLIGVWFAGLPGLLLGQALSLFACYPVQVWLARRHKAWDPLHDGIALAYALVVIALAMWLHYGIVSAAL